MKSYKDIKVNILEQTSNKSVVFTFGRFQPPTSGHQLLINKVIKEARKRRAEHRIYPSQSQDKKSNPLSHKDKVLYMRKLFPKANIIDDKNAKTPYHVLESLSKEGYKNVYFIVGGDRVSEFKNGMKKYVGKDGYNFDTFEVLSAGERDPDAEGVVGMSGSKMRKAASDNEFEQFLKGVPNKAPKRITLGLFKAIRKGMGLKESYQLDEQTFNVRLADTNETRAKGLMYEKSMSDDDGMLFVFDEENYHGIWMKNTYIPLDVVWINESGTIVDVQTMQPHDLNTHIPNKPAKYVLEVNAGTFDGAIGDTLAERSLLRKMKMDKFSRSERKRKKKLHKSAKRYNRKILGIESNQLDEAVTTAQIKKAMFKHTSGGLTVRSAKGKMDSRYVIVRANKIDNEIRKKLLKVAYPNAKVRGGDMDNISYGNISSNIISVKAEHWAKALGLKESYQMNESHLLGKTVIVGGKKGVVTKFLGDEAGTEMYQVKLEDGSVITSPAIEIESIDESFENMLNELSIQSRRKMARAAKRTAKRRAAKRKIKARRMKGAGDLKKKARKTAIMGFRNKMLKGRSWATLSHSEKENLTIRMKKKYKPAKIARVAQKLLPGIRKGERARIAALKGGKEKTNEQVQYLTEPQALENLVKKLQAEGMGKSKAYAIATAQLQKSGVLKKGTHNLKEDNDNEEFSWFNDFWKPLLVQHIHTSAFEAGEKTRGVISDPLGWNPLTSKGPLQFQDIFDAIGYILKQPIVQPPPEFRPSGRTQGAIPVGMPGEGEDDPKYWVKEARNYRTEYDNYQGSKEQREKRSSRNKARRIMTAKGLCKMGDGNDVDHKDRNPLNNDFKNLRVQKKEKNRSFSRKVKNDKPLEDGTTRTAKYHKMMTPGQWVEQVQTDRVKEKHKKEKEKIQTRQDRELNIAKELDLTRKEKEKQREKDNLKRERNMQRG